MTIKAIVVEQFGSAENMKYADVEMPEIGSKQVLIRVAATSVNFADIKARSGGKGTGKLPFIPGLEAAGVIERVGNEVTSLHRGQRVMAFPRNGSYAEYAVADEQLTFVIPDHLPFDAAGSCGIVSFLSYKLLADVAGLRQQEKVLIHSAAGGVGTTAVQVARALGAQTIIGTVGREAKAAAALEAGADHVINYAEENFSRKVNELTGGSGVSIVLDSIGGEITERSLGCLSEYGRLVVFGNSCGKYARLSTSELHSSCRSVLGFSFGTTRKERPETLRETSSQVFRLLESGQVAIQISERLSLKDAASAHRLIESRSSTGKIVLCPEHG